MRRRRLCRHQGRPRRRPPDPDGAVRRGCRPARHAARYHLDEHGVVRSLSRRRRQGKPKAPSSATTSTRRAARRHPRTARWPSSAAATKACCRSRWCSIRTGRWKQNRSATTPRIPHRRPIRHQGPGPPGRQVARRHRALDLEDQGLHAPRTRADECLRERGREEAIRVFGRNLKDLLLAAGPPAPPPRPRPGIPHRLQDRGRRPYRQAARHRHHLPARAAPRLGRFASWRHCAPSTRSSWSPSATAPPRARPTSWWPT